MTSLPISSNKLQTSGNAANTLQANIAADALAMDARSAEPFAFLLARQISETNLSVPSTAQTTIAIDSEAADGSTGLALKDAQGQATAAANIPGDPASTLAAILLQLPALEDRGQKIDGQQATQPFILGSSQGTGHKIPAAGSEDSQISQLPAIGQPATQPFVLGSSQGTGHKIPAAGSEDSQISQLPAIGQPATQPFVLGSSQGTGHKIPTAGSEDSQINQLSAIGQPSSKNNQQAMQPFISGSSQEAGHKRPKTGSEDSQIIQLSAIGHLPSEAVKRTELPFDLTQPTPNTAPAIASSAIPAAMPGMLTNNISTGTSPTINTPLGNNGWADEFSQKISWISTKQNQVAELHLNPPNLGPLDVVLKISDNQATILFTSPHGAVRDAVENALPKLREILADNGIMLGNTTISDQSPRDRSSDGFMNQDSSAAVRHEISGTVSEPAELPLVAAQTAPVRRHNGIVDTFA